MDLRNRYSLVKKLRSLNMECPTLLGVREVFGLEDLEFSILINKREDGDRIVLDRIALDGRE